MNTVQEEQLSSALSRMNSIEDRDDFRCTICLELVYKPIVQSCGHIFCFWCNHKAMNSLGVSYCALCRQPFSHFRRVCELLHFLLLKQFPVEYNKRAEETLELENEMNTFSPQFLQQPATETSVNTQNKNNILESNTFKAGDTDNKASTECIQSLPHDSLSTSFDTSQDVQIVEDVQTSEAHSQYVKITVDDALCYCCKNLLYCPCVLSCGHVFCQSCIQVSSEKPLTCAICQAVNPGDKPAVCLELRDFLERAFPEENKERVKIIQKDKEDVSAHATASKNAEKGVLKNAGKSLDFKYLEDQQTLLFHFYIGCDDCGVYPIVGKRYKCRDCSEAIGFDLCEACHQKGLVLPGRFNQQHTADHWLTEENGNAINLTKEQYLYLSKDLPYLMRMQEEGDVESTNGSSSSNVDSEF